MIDKTRQINKSPKVSIIYVRENVSPASTRDSAMTAIPVKFDHEDQLNPLDRNIGLAKKLEFIHVALQERFPFISRIAAAIYDPDTDLLKTFVHSSKKCPGTCKK